MELFKQTGPELSESYSHDPYLPALIKRWASEASFPEMAQQLQHMGDIATRELYPLQLNDRLNEPLLTQYSPWGERIDQIDVSPLWHRAAVIAAETGLVGIPYEGNYKEQDRLLQFALVYLFTPSSDIYSCPLAMTDGAARTLVNSGNQALIERALPRLSSRDPQKAWTSGQWMTELTGGSDVGLTETIARFEDGQWRLYGRKWFTSATTANMTLTLARPEGNGPGGKGLALFYVEPRDENGKLQNIEVMRLKDKLGTRKVPTAELLLKGVPAQLVLGTDQGVRNIAPMLNITRTWNSISAIALMRRGLSLAWSYARQRYAFGDYLINKPLHRETLLQLEAEFAGAFYLTFEMVQLLGHTEQHPDDQQAQAVLRFLTPIVKLTTAKQSVAVLSEVLESFGGAGYVEDTGLPLLFRDAQVLPIWEGTTNVLSLESLRGLGKSSEAVFEYLLNWTAGNNSPSSLQAIDALKQAAQWLVQTQSEPIQLEAGARRFALKVGRALEVLAIQRQLNHSLPQNDLAEDLSQLQARLFFI